MAAVTNLTSRHVWGPSLFVYWYFGMKVKLQNILRLPWNKFINQDLWFHFVFHYWLSNLTIWGDCSMKDLWQYTMLMEGQLTKMEHEAISTHLGHGWGMKDGYLSVKINPLHKGLWSSNISNPKPWAQNLWEWVEPEHPSIHIHAQETWWKILQWKCWCSVETSLHFTCSLVAALKLIFLALSCTTRL